MFPKILIESQCLKLVISNLLHLISDISAAVSWIMQAPDPLIVSVIKIKLIADESDVARRQDVGGFMLWHDLLLLPNNDSALELSELWLFCGCICNLSVYNGAGFNGGTSCSTGGLKCCKAPSEDVTNSTHAELQRRGQRILHSFRELVLFIILPLSCYLCHLYWSYFIYFSFFLFPEIVWVSPKFKENCFLYRLLWVWWYSDIDVKWESLEIDSV